MSVTIDHVFICCSAGGSEADALTRIGLKEGQPNTHPGQGTACRRFFFSNAYLELLWVSDPFQAQTEGVLPTRLWERWSNRGHTACPFGIVLRPAGDTIDVQVPFETFTYVPQYLPPGLAIDIAQNTPLSGPEIFHLGFLRERTWTSQGRTDHLLPIRNLAGVTLWQPSGADSKAARVLRTSGLVTFHDADEYLLELVFDDANRGHVDLRPQLPLTLRW